MSRQASLNGLDLINTGGTTVFFTPGIQSVLSPRFLVEAEAKWFPIHELPEENHVAHRGWATRILESCQGNRTSTEQ